ncbi:MAG: family 10 glycosylhydrolase [Victivallales bacterium]|nr:family 10 glycosylhydrolase [Victivallales bacterium]
MKRLFLFLLLFAVFLHAETDEKKASARSAAWLATQQPRPAELRGAWIHSAFGLPEKNWDETIHTLADNGFNAIFVNFCWANIAFYPSKVLSVHPEIAKRGDQLQQCLDACRKHGIALHVWKVCWNLGHHAPKEMVEQFQQAGRTQQRLNGDPTLFLAPHRLDNFTLERDAFREIVQKYPVDGIHLDYIRYPDSRCDFSPGARTAFEQYLLAQADPPRLEHWPEDCTEGGPLYSLFLQWRQENIDRLVRVVYQDAKSLRKDIAVSAAVYGSWDGSPLWIGQNADRWVSNHWVDFICPMDYTKDDEEFAAWLERQLSTTMPSGVPLYAGIGAWRLKEPVAVTRQIQIARELGADGVICFSLNPAFVQNVLPGLHAGITSKKTGTLMPHHSARAAFEVSEGHPGLYGNFLVGDSCTIQAKLPQGLPSGKIHAILERDGVPMQKVKLHANQEDTSLCYTIPTAFPGSYRLRLELPKQNFLQRSPVVNIITDEEAKEVRRRNGPPEFKMDGGIRVAVWNQRSCYGAQPILETLQKTKGIDASTLLNLNPSSFAPCQVIILPQPRVMQIALLNPKIQEALAAYVANGGAILTTHTMVGIRAYTSFLPKLVRGIAPPVPSNVWKTAPNTSLSKQQKRDLAALLSKLPSDPQKTDFPDAVSLKLMQNAFPVLLSENSECITAAVRHEKGKYLACGLGLGIGKDDQDAPLSPEETTFLLNAIRWLAAP